MGAHNKFRHSWWWMGALCLALALLEVGCGASAGSGAAPSGGGDTPVAVEIPALGEVSGLPFASGAVITGSSDISAKSMASIGKSMSKAIGVSGNPFAEGDSIVACETTNSWRVMLDAASVDDVNLCLIQGMAAPVKAAGKDLYDGEYHVIALTSGNPKAPSKFKVKAVRDSSTKVITLFELFTCGSSAQTNYDSHKVTNGTSVAITGVNVFPTEQSAITVSGTLSASDPTQYTTIKTMTYSVTGVSDAPYSGKGDLTQAVSTVLVNTFDTRDGDPRVYSSTDLISPTATPFTPKDYELDSGAGLFANTNGTTTGCWSGTSLFPVECLGTNSNYVALNDHAVRAIETVTTPAFSSDETWADCSTATPEVTITLSNADSSDSCFNLFTLGADHIDCTTTTAGAGGTGSAYYVQGGLANGGNTVDALSTSTSAPSSVTTTPAIAIGTSLASEEDTFNDSTVTVTDLRGGSVPLLNSAWTGDAKHFSFNLALTSGHEYTVTVTGGRSGVKSGTGLTMATTQVWYIEAQ